MHFLLSHHSHLVVALLVLIATVECRRGASSTPSDDARYSYHFATKSYTKLPINIGHMIEDAIRTNTSLKIDLKSNQLIHFAFFKCGVFALATMRRVNTAEHIFTGKSLQNLKNLMSKRCYANSRNISFEFFPFTPPNTNISLNFSKIAYTDPIVAQSLIREESVNSVENMAPHRISFVVPSNTTRRFPIQMKSIVRYSLQTADRRLQMTSSVWKNLSFKLNRCSWTFSGRRLAPIITFTRKRANQIYDLCDEDCDLEWLTDTINVIVTNHGDELVAGDIEFAIVEDIRGASKNGTQPTTSEGVTTSESITTAEVVTTSEDVTTSSFSFEALSSVVLPSIRFRLDWAAIYWVIVGCTGVLLLLLYYYINYEHSHSRSYGVAASEMSKRVSTYTRIET